MSSTVVNNGYVSGGIITNQDRLNRAEHARAIVQDIRRSLPKRPSKPPWPEDFVDSYAKLNCLHDNLDRVLGSLNNVIHWLGVKVG